MGVYMYLINFMSNFINRQSNTIQNINIEKKPTQEKLLATKALKNLGKFLFEQDQKMSSLGDNFDVKEFYTNATKKINELNIPNKKVIIELEKYEKLSSIFKEIFDKEISQSINKILQMIKKGLRNEEDFFNFIALCNDVCDHLSYDALDNINGELSFFICKEGITEKLVGTHLRAYPQLLFRLSCCLNDFKMKNGPRGSTFSDISNAIDFAHKRVSDYSDDDE